MKSANVRMLELTPLITLIIFSSAILEVVTSILPTTALGFMLAVFPVWSIISRIIIRIQGAPFSTGDTVTILKGKHRGKTTKVYETWGGERVRLELGSNEKASLTDIYFITDICKLKFHRSE